MEYLEGGAEDEVSLKRNRSIFERITWLPRMLVGTGLPDLSREVLGDALHVPLIIAPTGFNGMVWPQGDLALARAADAAGIAFTLSTVSNYDVFALNPQLQRPAWFQLYPLKDQKTSDRLIERAQAAGCDKLVVTVDVPALGAREWDQRNYSRPLKLSPSSVLDVLLHPRWLWQVMLPKGAPEFANLTEFLPRRRALGPAGRAVHGHADQSAAELGRHRAHAQPLEGQARAEGHPLCRGCQAQRRGRRRRHRALEPRRTAARFVRDRHRTRRPVRG